MPCRPQPHVPSDTVDTSNFSFHTLASPVGIAPSSASHSNSPSSSHSPYLGTTVALCFPSPLPHRFQPSSTSFQHDPFNISWDQLLLSIRLTSESNKTSSPLAWTITPSCYNHICFGFPQSFLGSIVPLNGASLCLILSIFNVKSLTILLLGLGIESALLA